MTSVPWDLALLAAGLLLVAATARALARHRAERRHGRLVAVDRPGDAAELASERYGLIGRPDALRRLADGRLIPIEVKHRVSPRGGPWRSHEIQVAAYCLLVEESSGRAPPYGLLRYGDGVEFRVPWDDAHRAAVLGALRRVRAPYDGAATPSRGKCARCPWRESCDAAAA